MNCDGVISAANKYRRSRDLVEIRVSNRIKQIDTATHCVQWKQSHHLPRHAYQLWLEQLGMLRDEDKTKHQRFSLVTQKENNNINGIYKHVPMSIFSELGMSET